jgi:hypothetical protein
VWRPEGKRPVGGRRHITEDDIKVNLKEVGWGGMDGIDLAQDKDRWQVLFSAVMNLRVP